MRFAVLHVFRGDFHHRGILGRLAKGGSGLGLFALHFRDQIGPSVGSQVIVVELTGRPEETAGDEVKVTGIRDRDIVMPHRGGE